MPRRFPAARFALIVALLALSAGASFVIGAEKKKKANKTADSSNAEARAHAGRAKIGRVICRRERIDSTLPADDAEASDKHDNKQ